MSLDDIILGRHPRQRARARPPSFVEGRVHQITPDGLMFTVPTWDDSQHVFGPCPWPVWSGATPNVGDVCLIVSAPDLGRSWCLGWWVE